MIEIKSPSIIPPLQRWGKPEPLRAAKLNKTVDALNELHRGVRPVRQLPLTKSPKSKVLSTTALAALRSFEPLGSGTSTRLRRGTIRFASVRDDGDMVKRWFIESEQVPCVIRSSLIDGTLTTLRYSGPAGFVGTAGAQRIVFVFFITLEIDGEGEQTWAFV